MWSRLSNPYSGISRARCTIGDLGNLTPIISTALRYSPAFQFSLSTSPVGHRRDIPVTNFVEPWREEVVLLGIHALPYCKTIFIVIGPFICLDLGISVCLAIGLWVNVLISNGCAFLLSPTVPTPQTKVIGDPVARFARPFESRPTDPVRQEVFRQLVAHPGTASTSGWVPPASLLPVTPPLLPQRVEERASALVPSAKRGRRRLAL